MLARSECNQGVDKCPCLVLAALDSKLRTLETGVSAPASA